jgi:predicted dienelactone hydrolase
MNATPAANERHPLIVFSHGRGSGVQLSASAIGHGDEQWPFLTHLASHGFVVVAPDHRDCASACHDPHDFEQEASLRADDIVAVVDGVLALSEGQDTVLAQLIDPHRIGLLGASLGGFGVLRVLETDPRVKAAVLLAPGPIWFDSRNPTLPLRTRGRSCVRS